MPENRSPIDREDNPIYRFLFACLRARLDPSALDKALALTAEPDFDWDAVGDAAGGERLLPLLHKVLDGRPEVEPSLAADLAAAYRSTAIRNTLLFHELERVLGDLGRAGIEAILLKGVALSHTVYAREAVRPFSDMDILIRAADRDRIAEALAPAYRQPTPVMREEQAGEEYEHEIQLYKDSPVQVMLEPHWRLFTSGFFRERVEMDWFWETALPTTVGRAPARVLGPEAQLLHLCGHLMLQHWRSPLIWVHDVAEVLAHYRESIDWDLLLDRAQAFGLVLALREPLLRVERDWGAPIPARTMERLWRLQPSREEARVFAAVVGQQRTQTTKAVLAMQHMSNWRERLRFALVRVLPSPSYMRWRYGLRSPLLVPLAYPYRWFTALGGVLWDVLWGREDVGGRCGGAP